MLLLFFCKVHSSPMWDSFMMTEKVEELKTESFHLTLAPRSTGWYIAGRFLLDSEGQMGSTDAIRAKKFKAFSVNVRSRQQEEEPHTAIPISTKRDDNDNEVSRIKQLGVIFYDILCSLAHHICFI